MRLKHIKLSGFKSFVDPTSVSFPANLVGVVGPNGCGKSMGYGRVVCENLAW